MACTTPDCTGEPGADRISHEVVYRERTYVIHAVPADICPECGDVRVIEETLFHIGTLLQRKGRSKSAVLVYEC